MAKLSRLVTCYLKNKIKGKIGSFSFKDGKVFQELSIYKTDKNTFTKF